MLIKPPAGCIESELQFYWLKQAFPDPIRTQLPLLGLLFEVGIGCENRKNVHEHVTLLAHTIKIDIFPSQQKMLWL